MPSKPMKRYPTHTAEQTLWTGEVQAPFNLAGEPIDNSVTDEGEARVRALAEMEARKAQESMNCAVCGLFFADCVCVDPQDD